MLIPIIAPVSVSIQMYLNKAMETSKSGGVSVVAADFFKQEPMSPDTLAKTIEVLKKSFVQLLSDDLKEKQAWGLSYATKSGTALLVRSLDLFRYSKSSAEVVMISPNREMAVITNQWKHLNLAPTELNLDGPKLLFPPVEGRLSATLLYPSKAGEVRQSRLDFVVTKGELGKLPLGRTTVQLPSDCASGVGIVVDDSGKYTPISLESSETGVHETTSLVWGLPLPVGLNDIKGRGIMNPVLSLTNVNSVELQVIVKDDIDSTAKSKVQEYVTMFLREECPRLIQRSSSDNNNVALRPEQSIKTRVEQQAFLNVLGSYQTSAKYTLVCVFGRRSDGLVMVLLQVLGSALTNGGQTGVALYTDWYNSVSKFDNDVIRDSLKVLIKSFADEWIRANPRDNE